MEITTFDEVRKFLSNIPNINFGGCGIAALSMCRWLVKNEGERPKIITLYESRDSYKLNKKYFRGNDQNNLSKPRAPAHCGIQYKRNFIDTENSLPFFPSSFYFDIFNQKKILILINKGAYWGPSFEREKAVPQIEERLGIDLSDVCLRLS
jgi:hypothetical protein